MESKPRPLTRPLTATVFCMRQSKFLAVSTVEVTAALTSLTVTTAASASLKPSLGPLPCMTSTKPTSQSVFSTGADLLNSISIKMSWREYQLENKTSRKARVSRCCRRVIDLIILRCCLHDFLSWLPCSDILLVPDTTPSASFSLLPYLQPSSIPAGLANHTKSAWAFMDLSLINLLKL